MARPRKPDHEQTTPVSVRLRKTGVARIDEIKTTRGTDRTEVIAMLLGLGMQSWERGARPPIKR